jgi:hypothetical protein|tara:strand:- start:726 stop:1040 length:315 start_codon:yes stop_codon:yes gene_type:complete
MSTVSVKMCITQKERDFLDEQAKLLDCSRSSLLRRLVFSKAELPVDAAPKHFVTESTPKVLAQITPPVGREPIDRAIAKVNRDYDIPRRQVESLVCAVVTEITS